MRIVDLGIAYHIGSVRPDNQDALALVEQPAHGTLLVVADGMGGHNGGQLASGRAVATLGHWFQQEHLSAWFARLEARERGHAMTRLLHQNLLEVNGQLVRWGQERPELARMGTTLTALWFYEDQLALAHIGDSRAALWRQGTLFPLTQEHSWVAEQVRLGRLHPAEARVHPHRNRLLRALGTELGVRVDQHLYTLQPNDTLVVYSDGLSAYISDEELGIALGAPTTLQGVADGLLQTIFARGASDNITLVLACVSAKDAHPQVPTARIQRDVTPTYEEDIATIIEPLRTSLASGIAVGWRLLFGVALCGSAATAGLGWYYASSLSRAPHLALLLVALGGLFMATVATVYWAWLRVERGTGQKDTTYG